MGRRAAATWVPLLVSSTLFGLAPGAARAYNSEEHKLATDNGVAQVTLDPSVVLPYPTRFYDISPTTVLNEFRAAKRKAVGFDTNTQGDYDENQKGPQDNSYWGPDFHQLKYNKALWIPSGPDSAFLTDRRLQVVASLDGRLRGFTLGELVALYGDYRRTTHCVGEACYLTDSNDLKSSSPGFTYGSNGNMHFKRGYDCFAGIFNCGWEPTEIPAEGYLRHIASGLVPPFNVAGNVAYRENDYGEAGWWGDEMMRIATMNDWHFSDAAVAWYVGMHRLALLSVERAVTDPSAWNEALHYEANGLHSLTDLFAFGHVVVSRDQTSWGVVDASGAGGSAQWTWMRNVIEQGGGVRVARACGRSSSCQRIEFGSDLAMGLPPLQDVANPRNDFMASYVNSVAGLSWASWANSERTYHDDFNVTGACVRNLNGDSFRITGDGRLHHPAMKGLECGASPVPGLEVMAAAVRASVQSLFDAYSAIASGSATADELASLGSPHYAALRFIPAWVNYDMQATVGGVAGSDRFAARWPHYAGAIDLISGAGVVPSDWNNCAMAYVSGDHAPPDPDRPRCQEFPLMVLPATATAAPGESVAFTAKGGTDAVVYPAAPGYVWSLEAGGSGGTIGPASGVYTAGARGGATDIVFVTDTDGTVVRAIVTVTGDPPAPSSGGGCATGGGAGAFSLLLAAWVLRRLAVWARSRETA